MKLLPVVIALSALSGCSPSHPNAALSKSEKLQTMSPRDQILVQQYALAMGQKPRNSLNGMPTAELYRADIVKAARLWRFHENARHAFSMRPVDAYLASQ